MTKDERFTLFYRSLMAGLIVGIIATVLNLVFDFIFRDYTTYVLSDIINVSSIIFITLAVVVLAGMEYYLLARYLKLAVIIHVAIWILLTVLCVYIAGFIQRSDDPTVTTQFRELLLGIIYITFGTTAILIPYFAKYDRSIV